jgi:hypothetical protein
MQAFVEAFQSLGYQVCASPSLEAGVEKIAIFGIRNLDPHGPSVLPTHAALQLKSGEWTSKLGMFEDISHLTVDCVDGPIYGRAMIFMSRLLPADALDSA